MKTRPKVHKVRVWILLAIQCVSSLFNKCFQMDQHVNEVMNIIKGSTSDLDMGSRLIVVLWQHVGVPVQIKVLRLC